MSRSLDFFASGRVALVTGAAMGIGRAASLYLAERGMAVAMVDLPGDELEGAVKAVKERAEQAGHSSSAILSVPGDLAEPGASAALYEAAKQALGPVNFLMNNAVTRTGRGYQADRDQWRKAMDVNFWAVVDMVDACLDDLLSGADDGETPGLIVNVGSKQGITNPPGQPIYNVTKSAL